ncbi:MAG: hypothetical protein KGI79_03315 [Patescibacteria group bacterium]|nr:hypothetical protein [Patescibacteria group bacterium]MDE2116876.1 hypothetical protein [Patescibacteria group bacterium]
MAQKIKIGLDLHGVVDARPELFRELARALIANGHEVHIITGGRKENETALLKSFDIPYTHFFSITDHHESLGTPIEWDENGDPHLDTYLWDKTKAEYCLEHGIDLHVDDSDIYHYFFKTPYTRFYTKDSYRNKKIHLETLSDHAKKIRSATKAAKK